MSEHVSRPLNWINIGWLFLSPLAMLFLLPWFIFTNGVTVIGVFWFLLACAASNLSITAGYHRLFSHLSFEASSWVRIMFLLVGAGNFQGSALQWASDHRRHHRHVDTNNDPYNIKKGFFYAHMGWLFYHEHSENVSNYPKDLTADKWVVWQHQYYVWIAIGMGFVFPWIVGAALGNAWGGLIIGGLTRVVVCQHATFLINSLSHVSGRQTYTLKNSARDNVLMAFLAFGEGWHSFHHRFQSDFRNGVRWYHWDPTKWLIWMLSLTGQARNLRTVPAELILRARMQTEEARLRLQGVPCDRLQVLKDRFDLAQKRWWAALDEYKTVRARMGNQSRLKIAEIRAELKLAKIERKMAFRQWCAYVRTMRSLRPVPALR